VKPNGANQRLRYETVEYRSGNAPAGEDVLAFSTGMFASLEAAIEAARQARSSFEPEVEGADAWWAVWNLDTQSAEWIAEFGTPEESVIDLTDGRRRRSGSRKSRR
jgi:hypothetical protein